MKKKVLDEEDWEDSLKKIITRDYFPDLPELQCKIDIENAIKSQEPQLVEILKEKLEDIQSEKNAKKKTPEIPTEITPKPLFKSKKNCQKQKLKKSEWEEEEGEGEGDCSFQNQNCENTKIIVNLSRSLSHFVHNFQSEDNESYSKIVENDKKILRESIKTRYGIEVEEDEEYKNPLAIENDPLLMLTSLNDSQNDNKNQRDMVLRGDIFNEKRGEKKEDNRIHKKRVMNNLMFTPDVHESITQKEQDKKIMTMFDFEKKIEKKNTRFSSQFLRKMKLKEVEKKRKNFRNFGGKKTQKKMILTSNMNEKMLNSDLSPTDNDARGRMKNIQKIFKQRREGLENYDLDEVSESNEIYPIIKTPMITPTSENVPMTWGTIDDVLDIPNDKNASLINSHFNNINNEQQIFQIPKPPLREQLCHKLTGMAIKKMAKRKRIQSGLSTAVHRDSRILSQRLLSQRLKSPYTPMSELRRSLKSPSLRLLAKNAAKMLPRKRKKTFDEFQLRKKRKLK